MRPLKDAGPKIKEAILRYFPEHKIYLHRGSEVRLITIGTRVQLMAVGAAALVAGWLGVATVGVISTAGSEETIAAKDAVLARMHGQLAAMKADVADLKGDVALTAARIEQRQAFLASLLSGKASLDQLVAMMPKAQLAAADHDDAHSPVLEPFKKLEREQLAFVDTATVAAEARYRDTQALLRRLGLSPSRLMGQTAIAMGGPAEALPLEGAEPKFKDLFLSWKKLDQLEKSLLSVPSLKPVKSYTYTSGFGVRYDPFTGATALHAGVDMAGPVGEPIYAAADGVVEKAGYYGAYGNMIDLGHGKGIATRYGHLSRVAVRAGDRVKRGELIGYMGSTGRSTGSHLHYEVRIDGRAVNPMPFLEAGEKLLAVQERADEGQGGPEQPAG